MKIRTEISENDDDEIIIRCRSKTEKILQIEAAIDSIVRGRRELVLYIGDTEYYVPVNDVLFFESGGGKVYAHTNERMYTATYKLFELEEILPSSFVRISKSSIANVMRICSLHREIVGNGEISFYRSDKITYFSRAYYKLLKDRIEEMRFS